MFLNGFWDDGDSFDKVIKDNMEILRKLPAGDFFRTADKILEDEKMEIGEKYLSIIVLGGKAITCFPNKKKVPGDKQPDFKGDGIAVWVNEKREKKEEVVQKSAL